MKPGSYDHSWWSSFRAWSCGGMLAPPAHATYPEATARSPISCPTGRGRSSRMGVATVRWDLVIQPLSPSPSLRTVPRPCSPRRPGALRVLRLMLLDLSTGDRSFFLTHGQLPTDEPSRWRCRPTGLPSCSATGSPAISTPSASTARPSPRSSSTAGYCYADWGVDDQIVASKGIFPGDGRRLIVTMVPDGTHLEGRSPASRRPRTSGATLYVLAPSWAPDATSVVFGAQRHLVHPDIWAVDADGSNLRKLTATKARSETSPAYSPDGTTVVFSRTGPPSAQFDLWLMGADGSTPTRLTNTPDQIEYGCHWHPKSGAGC